MADQTDNDDQHPRLLTAAQVAQRLGGGDITAVSVKRGYRAWGLKASPVGRKLRWKESDVDAFIETRNRT